MLLNLSVVEAACTQSNKFVTSVKIKRAALQVTQTLMQGFWYFRWLQSRKFQVNLQNPAKFIQKTHKLPQNSLEIVPNRCWHNIFEPYLGCWGCCLCQKEPRSQTNTHTYNSPKELLKFSCKTAGFRKAMLIHSQCFCDTCHFWKKEKLPSFFC